jgi:hypothetical protein
MRRRTSIFLSIILVMVVCTALTLFLVSRTGSGGIEQWIGSQLQDIVNSRLNPQLTFSDLDYEYPMTVSVKDLKLVADDPRSPDRKLDIIGCGVATLTLAEVPRVGKPIVIQQITLNRPQVSIIAEEPGGRKFVGFSPFVRAPTTGPASGPATRPRPVLSDHLRMRLIQIVDGRIVYDPRLPDTEPMALDQVTTNLNFEPTEPGWYKVSGAVARRPVFEISAAGQVNLDTFTARDAALKIKADLSPSQLGYLPPQLQQFLTKYQVRGILEAMVIGEMPILKPLSGQGAADLSLSDANVTLGEYQIAVARMELSARFEDAAVHLPVVKVEALRGSLSGWMNTQLNDQLDTDLAMEVRGMMLQDLLASRTDGQPPKFAGKVDAELEFKVPMRAIADQIRGHQTEPLSRNWGTARLAINEGRLINLPTVRKLFSVVQSTLRLIGASDDGSSRDRLNVRGRFTGDHAEVTELTLVSSLIAARGRGTIGLDQSLDLTVYAGPLEKMQDLLGSTLGGAIATVTDKLVSYKITGKIGAPQVRVNLASGAVDTVGGTIGRIGEGIGELVNPTDKGQ